MKPLLLFDRAAPQENAQIQENFCFLHLTELELWNSKLSELIPLLRMIAREWQLNLKDKKHWDICCNILRNSIKCN